MKTKTELLAELEQAQKRIAELENTITNSKKAVEKTFTVEELHTSKKWFTTLFRSNPVPVGITRKTDFRIVDVNDAWSTLTGYSREEALGRTSTELGLARPQTLQTIREQLQTQSEIRQNEILLYTRSGQERHVLISSEQIEIDGESYFLNNLLDVTESKLFEKKLRESEESYKTLFESNPHPMWVYDLQTLAFLTVNEAAIRHYGYSREEFLSKTLLDIRPPEDSQRLFDNVTAVTEGLDEAGTWRHLKKDGTIIDVEITSHTLDYYGHNAELVLAHDITERKLAEEKLRESEEVFRTFVEQSHDGIMLSDARGKVIEWNPALVQTSGLERNVTLGMNAWDVQFQMMTPEKRSQITVEQLKTGMQNVMKEERHPKFNAPGEFEIQTPQGERKILSQTSFPIYSQVGYRLGAIIRDITASKKADEKLRESEARFATVFFTNPAPQSILSLVTGQAMEVNESTCRLFGYSREELIGAEPGTLNLWAEPNEQITALEELKTSGHLLPRVVTIRKKSGETRSIIFTAEQITWKAEPCLITSSLDITERKQVEIALERTRNTLEQAQKIAHMGSFEYIANTQATVWSEEEYRIYGLDPTKPSPAYEEMLQQMIHPDDADLLHNVFTKAMQNNSIYELEHRILRPDGSVRWVHDRAVPYLNKEGELERYIGITLDITERKLAEQKIRESEENYRGLMESLDSVVATIDYNGRFLYMNDVAAKVLGDIPENLIGKTMEELFPEPAATQQLEGIRLVIQEGIGRVTENITFVNGEARWFRNSLQPIHNENGEVVYTLLNSTDIHELKSTQQELAELNRTLEERIKIATAEIQDLYDHAPTGYHSLDADGRFVMINQTELEWLGYTREELIGSPIADLLTESSRATLEIEIPHLITDGKIIDREIQVTCKDGSIRDMLVNATAIYDPQGNFLHTRSTLVDITNRKKADEALKASETKYRQLFENMNEGFSLQEIITDENGQPVDFRYLDANNLFERHSGLSPQNLIGKTARELFSQIDPRSLQNYGTVALTGEPITIEYFSTLINRYLSVRAFSPKHGQFATIFEDITERKQAEEKLNESYARLDFANRELERAMRAKDEFLANMSHELRTPLNAIIGLSDSMLEISFNDFTPKQQKYLNTIRESGQHLLNLINDVLDLAKVGAGQLVLETHAVDLTSVCQASLRMIKQLAANKNLNVHFEIDQNIYSINADERRLKQMLVNLLNNAVKFTPPTGEIGLEVRGDNTKQQVRFTVWDTGIGISKEDQVRLFQPFMQVNSSLSREFGGTGLGLALVSEMARLHGGTVSLESEPGKGSRFSFTLPWSDSEAIVSPQKTGSTSGLSLPPTTIHDKKPTILLVEDTETAVMTTRDYLEAKGYFVEVAQNGQDGIKVANQIKPNLILMDVQMPVMDGLEATRRLRAQAEFKNTPIIALTAYAMQEDHDRCIAAGATDYMSKPYKLSLLVQKIEHLLKDKRNK